MGNAFCMIARQASQIDDAAPAPLRGVNREAIEAISHHLPGAVDALGFASWVARQASQGSRNIGMVCIAPNWAMRAGHINFLAFTLL
jgi:hypothetical protein